MGIEATVEYAHVGKACEGRQGPIRAAAVNHDNVLGPCEWDSVRPIFCSSLYVNRHRGNLLIHLPVRPRRTRGLSV